MKDYFSEWWVKVAPSMKTWDPFRPFGLMSSSIEAPSDMKGTQHQQIEHLSDSFHQWAWRPQTWRTFRYQRVKLWDQSAANTQGTMEVCDMKELQSYTDLSKQNRVWSESKFKTFKPEGKGRRGWERWRQLDWSLGNDCSHRGRRGCPLLVAEKDLFFSAFFGISLAMCCECQLSFQYT